jgi:hypothetical protein
LVEEEVCCPVGAICTGTGAFANQGVCCTGQTPECCIRENGEPVCIDPETQCCTDAECPDDPRFCETGVCLRESQTCDFSFDCGDGGTCCPGQVEDEIGACVEDDQCCTSVECQELTDFPQCEIGICNREVFRCEVVSACDLDQDCCALNDSGGCAPVEDRTTCALEEGGSGICCSGECADTSLCACTRNVECDADRCEECFEGRCRVRCGHTQETFDLPVCDGAGNCVECLVDDDCFGFVRYCNPETNTCFACRTDDDCFECTTCDESTGSCVADLSVQGAPCEIPGETGFSCCFGDCMPTCATCSSDADCAACETCNLSAGPDLAHCQPCFFNFGGCCFDDFCLPDGADCCQTDADCPPPECSGDTLSVVRYECVPVTASGGFCQAVIAETCDGCSSCEETAAGPQCVAGCQPGRACCVTDVCQPLRTCPFGCEEDVDCSGECHTCVNGFCEVDQDKCFGECGFCANTGVCVANAQLCPGECHVCSFNPGTNTGDCIDWDPLCPTGESCVDGTCGTPCDENTPCPGECHSCVAGFCAVDQDKCFGDCGFCAVTGVCVANAALCSGDCQICRFNPETNTGACEDFDDLCPDGEMCVDGECGLPCNEQSPCPGECHTCADVLCRIDQDKCFGDCGFCANTGVCVANAQRCGACQICLFNPDTNTGVCEDRDTHCPTGEVCVEGVCRRPCGDASPCPGECHSCVGGFCRIDQSKCFGDCGFCANTGVCVANAQRCPGSCHVCSFNPGTNAGDCIDWDPLCGTGEVCCGGECEVGQACEIVPTTTTSGPVTTTTTGVPTITMAGPATTTAPPATTTTVAAAMTTAAPTAQQECASATCASLGVGCGTVDDGCGGLLDCGACPGETTPSPAADVCLGEGERCVDDGQCCAGLCRGRGCQDRGRKSCQAACTG